MLSEVPYTIQDALAEKPRLCWVWDNDEVNPRDMLMIVTRYKGNDYSHPFTNQYNLDFKHAELATLEEIKQFLED